MIENKSLSSNLMKSLVLMILFTSSFNVSSEESLPELGDTSSSAISLDSEYRLGRLYMAQLRRSVPDLKDPLVQDYSEHLIYRLSEYSQLEDRRLEIVIIKDESINAFAAPGGIIGLYSGLLYHSETEGQLVSVLSH